MREFLRQFFEKPLQTGAVLPSSPVLARAMTDPIDFKKAKLIVELGPGTGAITKELLKRMRKDAKLVALEINKRFCKELGRIEDRRLAVVQGNAKELSKIVPHADVVVSGLPLVSFSDKDHDRVLSEIEKVARQYVQFHYSPLAEGHLKRYFKRFKRKIVLRNVPPAIVYDVRW